MTHRHVRSQVCCAFYCLGARYTFRGDANPWDRSIGILRDAYRAMPEYEQELEFNIRPGELRKGRGSGYRQSTDVGLDLDAIALRDRRLETTKRSLAES